MLNTYLVLGEADPYREAKPINGSPQKGSHVSLYKPPLAN